MEEEKLEEMYELTKDNNRILHGMRRNARIMGIIKFLIWFVVLVGVPYLGWLYISPYVRQVQGTYQSVQTQSQSFANSPVGKFFSQFGTTTKK